ncbi:MAG: hypothetical protein ABSC95_24695 [Acetobacteraceae bacterium]|jgi:hypothetical protein
MYSKSRISAVAQTMRHQGRMRPNAIVRFALLGVAVCAMSGCAHDVVVQNPHTGATEICRESLHGLDPWSQAMSCVADHIAQGWTRSDQE